MPLERNPAHKLTFPMAATLFPLAAGNAAPAADMLETGLHFTGLAGAYFACAAALYVMLIVAGRGLKRRLHLPLGWSFNFFCLALALYLPTLHPSVHVPGARHLGAAAIILGAFVIVGVVRHLLFDVQLRKGEGAQVPKFLGEFISIVAIVAAVLAVLQFVYGIKVPGLLAGAGIAGIVLGLALQDTLGNIFSGFAIYFGGQFKAGDWLLVDGYHAQIVEINWRSTRLRTTDDLSLDIPNSSITKQTVINYNSPTSVHGMRIEIGLEYDAPPSLVKTVLAEAALDCPHVLRDPAPMVFVKRFADWSIIYELRFWLDDHAKLSPANSHIHSALWYSLRRHGIAIPYPIQQEQHFPTPAPPPENRDLIREALEKSLFAPALSAEQLAEIVARSRIVRFGQGECIIRQDADAGPMFVLVSGRAEVWVEHGDKRTKVADLGPDACIGESSVLTGEPRGATVRAAADCTAVEVDKSTLAPIIAACPELLDALSGLLARRRMRNEGIVSEAAGADTLTETRYKDGFLGKLRAFFQI